MRVAEAPLWWAAMRASGLAVMPTYFLPPGRLAVKAPPARAAAFMMLPWTALAYLAGARAAPAPVQVFAPVAA